MANEFWLPLICTRTIFNIAGWTWKKDAEFTQRFKCMKSYIEMIHHPEVYYLNPATISTFVRKEITTNIRNHDSDSFKSSLTSKSSIISEMFEFS